VTEDGVEKPLAQVGLVRTVTRLRGYRQDISTSARAGGRGSDGRGSGRAGPAGGAGQGRRRGKLSELELVATRSRADGLLFNVDGMSGRSALAMDFVPRPEQLETRDEAIRIAMHYPRGLSNAKTFNAIGTPFAPEAFRLENGALMAGPAARSRRAAPTSATSRWRSSSGSAGSRCATWWSTSAPGS
jgi:hypothetical protein